MIDKNDIRIIDFGIAELLSVGPSIELVSDYICTEIDLHITHLTLCF